MVSKWRMCCCACSPLIKDAGVSSMIANEMLYTTLDGINCPTFLVRSNIICFANAAAFALFGVSSPDDLYALAPSDLIQTEFHAALQGWPSETLTLSPIELQLNTRAHSDIWVQLSA